MRLADRCWQTGDVLRIAQDVVYVYPYRPLRVVVDAILRHIVAGLLRERAYIFQPWGKLVRKAPEIPVQHTGLPLVPVKAAIDRLVPACIQAGMEAGKFVLHMEIARRLLRVPFFVKINDLFFEYRVDIYYETIPVNGIFIYALYQRIVKQNDKLSENIFNKPYLNTSLFIA